MASEDNSITLLIEAIIVSIVTLGGAIATVYHFVFKRGQKDATDQNTIKGLKERLDKLEKRLDQKEKDANEIHSEIKVQLAEIRGYLIAKFGPIDNGKKKP